VVLTPHIASATIPTRMAMAMLAADNLVGFLIRRQPVTPLNPQVLALSQHAQRQGQTKHTQQG
jgi:gluconate 2-dehydrogenase